jgi:hypothetical protein
MHFKRANDNIYKIGAVVTTRENRERKLVVRKYIHRTYYCVLVGNESGEFLTYFERDLVAAPERQ